MVLHRNPLGASSAQHAVGQPHAAGVTGPLAVHHATHDAAAMKHGIPSGATKFFISSFDYIKEPYFPVHPAFADWAKNAGPAYITLVWREFRGYTLPVAVEYEYQNSTKIDYLPVPAEGHRIVHEHIADIVVEEEKHLLHKNKEALMLVEAGSKHPRPVRGEVFRPKGGSTFFPSKGDPGVHLLTQAFTKDGHQSIWEVQNDKSLLIMEQGGAHKVGIITAEESIRGYIVQGPITFDLDPDSKYPETYRDELIVHVLLALVIMPVHRPANMTKMLWWLRKLGGIALENGSGAF